MHLSFFALFLPLFLLTLFHSFIFFNSDHADEGQTRWLLFQVTEVSDTCLQRVSTRSRCSHPNPLFLPRTPRTSSPPKSTSQQTGDSPLRDPPVPDEDSPEPLSSRTVSPSVLQQRRA